MGQCPGCFRKLGEPGSGFEAFELTPKGITSQVKGLGKLVNFCANVKSSGRVGSVVAFDPKDKLHTYKLQFGDGASPESDWFAEESVCLSSNAFTVVVDAIFASDKTEKAIGEEFKLDGLLPGDTLLSLYERIEKRLNVPRSRIHLSHVGATLFLEYDLSDSLCKYGLGEDARVDCFITEYDPTLIEIVHSGPESEYQDGEVITREVVALVYGPRQADNRMLLWASMMSRSGRRQSIKGCDESDVTLSADRSELLISGNDTSNDRESKLAISALFSKARTRIPETLEKQLKDCFGEDTWAMIQGRLCRKLLASL
eukprot:TRINITY_DN4821_c0_g2_i1.p1 TRINITY_DN4821_c0_g2~~TRINITY_DN4821_c0_g2_i1.p1  ORF type:complete len:314 (+),score=53.75 TRINITY_DN4821_c0_g2_i1:108-1049(+)